MCVCSLCVCVHGEVKRADGYTLHYYKKMVVKSAEELSLGTCQNRVSSMVLSDLDTMRGG